jgi:hypothetical protein
VEDININVWVKNLNKPLVKYLELEVKLFVDDFANILHRDLANGGFKEIFLGAQIQTQYTNMSLLQV